MSIKIELYGKDRFVDITNYLKSLGGSLPDSFTEGIFPDDLIENTDKPSHFDLLGAINMDDHLRENFFDGKVHPMRITNSDGGTFDVRVLIETRYSSRNA